MEQETVSGSGISWAICKSAPRSRQITIYIIKQRFNKIRKTEQRILVLIVLCALTIRNKPKTDLSNQFLTHKSEDNCVLENEKAGKIVSDCPILKQA